MGGLMITDAMQAVSYLSSRHDVDPHRIAVMGFSMGSFITSLTGAVDPRIHSVLLVGGGDLDGPNGYWDLSHVMMCQGGPYRSLAFLGDRPAVLFTLHARRGDTFIINGTADTVVDIPHHGPDFFADLRQRVITLNGSDKGVFTNYFDPGASHRPSWVTPRAATWLNNQLHFPAWQGKDPDTLPTIRIGDWAARVGAAFSKNYDRNDRDAGIIALAADVPHLTVDQLDVLPPHRMAKPQIRLHLRHLAPTRRRSCRYVHDDRGRHPEARSVLCQGPPYLFVRELRSRRGLISNFRNCIPQYLIPAIAAATRSDIVAPRRPARA